MKEQIRLVSLGIQSYGRIDKEYKPEVKYPEGFADIIKDLDPDGGLFIIFPDGYRVAILEGNEGVGKTSVITCLKEATGNIAPPDFAVNTIDNDKKFKERFYGKDGKLYEIRGTRSTYVLEEIETDDQGKPVTNEKGKEIKKEVKSAKSMVQKLAGPAGVDPTTLKNMSGDEQIKWIRDQYSLPMEALKLESETAQKRTEAYNSRTTANSNHKRYSTLVMSSEEFKLNEWEENEKYFKETNFDDIETKVKDIQQKYNGYLEYQRGTDTLKQNRESVQVIIDDTTKEIAELELKLKTAKEKLAEQETKKTDYDKRITEREKWLTDNENIKKENDDIAEDVRKATEFNAKKGRWETWKENKRLMDHYSDESIRLTNLIDGYDKWKQDFIKSFTPTVPGLEICIPDENEKRHGFIYFGKESKYWSESETWTVASQLWEQLGIRMIFVENISGLGSGAVEKFNDFVNNGGYIFGSLMNRKEKNLKVTITNQIPE